MVILFDHKALNHQVIAVRLADVERHMRVEAWIVSLKAGYVTVTCTDNQIALFSHPPLSRVDHASLCIYPLDLLLTSHSITSFKATLTT